jgi:proteasome lid subunit RPN8/RPN11
MRRTRPRDVPAALVLPRELRLQIRERAQAAYPHEACGLILGRPDPPVALRLAVARNLAADRLADRYVLDPEAFLAADRTARAEELEVIGIWHSHPDHPARPSTTDLEGAWEGYSYVIVTTTAGGPGDLASWRLDGAGFAREPILGDREDRPS